MNTVVRNFIEAGRHPHPSMRNEEEDEIPRQSIIDSQKRRDAKREERRMKRLGIGALVGSVVVAGAAAYSVWTMAGSQSTERIIPDNNTPELTAPSANQETHFYKLSVLQENDVWRYTVLLSEREGISLDDAMEAIADANPETDFNKIPVGGEINVPALTFPALADQAGLKTDQPIGDVHIN